MSKFKRTLSLEAARAALETRQKHGKQPWEALDVIDLAEAASLEVLFVPLGSLEGMYYSGETPTILLPSDRPPGRQAFFLRARARTPRLRSRFEIGCVYR